MNEICGENYDESVMVLSSFRFLFFLLEQRENQKERVLFRHMNLTDWFYLT